MSFWKKMTGRDMAGFILFVFSLVMLGRSFSLCFSNDIWYDELFTVGMAEHSYGELVRFTAADVHPPLYYCIVKLFADLCKLFAPGVGTVIPAKIVSVLPYFILLIYAVTFIRKRFGIFVGGLFLFCVTAMPQLPAYTVEVRMYGWALLFVTAAFLHGYALVWYYVNRNAEPEKAAAGVAYGGKGAAGQDAAHGSTGAAGPDAAHGGKGVAGPDAAYGSTVAAGQTMAYGRRDAKEPQAGRQVQSRGLHGAALVIYGLAAAYTQYFACVAVVMVYLFLLLAFWFLDRRRVREWFLYVAVSVICYVPWLFALAGQLGAVNENYWILPLTWRSLGGCVKFLMKPAFADDRVNTVLAVILFASYLGLWCRWMLKLFHNGRENEKTKEIEEEIRERDGTDKIQNDGSKERFLLATACIGVLAGLVAFGFAASFLLRPVFVYRYMIPALGCFWLGFALCLNEVLCKPVSRRKGKTCGGHTAGKLCKPAFAQSSAAYYAGIALTILVTVAGLRDYRAFMGEEEYKIRLMAETEAGLAMIGAQDSVLYNFDQVQAVTGYYLPETVERYLWQAEGETLIQEITSSCGTVEAVEEMREMLSKTGEDGQEKNLWFIGSFNSREDIVAEWRRDGLAVEEMGSFLLERYWFNLYKIS